MRQAAELIVMTTEGPHGFLDGLRGQHVRAGAEKSALPSGEPPLKRMHTGLAAPEGQCAYSTWTQNLRVSVANPSAR